MASTETSPQKLGLLKDMYVSVVFLTRLPAPSWPDVAERPLAPAMWTFPLVGVLVGTVGALAYAICDAMDWPMLVAGLIAVTAMTVVTGGLHEDGLSDLADGAWSGNTVARRMEIMSDSRIGAFGTIALILSMVGRAAAVADLGAPAFAFGGMVAAAAISRAMIPVAMAFGTPAKKDGLGAGAGTPDFTVWAGGLLIAGIVVALVAPGGWATCLIGALAGALLVGWFAERQLGGYTGDTLGAVQQVAELIALAFIGAAISGVY